MKFFSKFIMTKEHLKYLRESRKVYVNAKVVDYSSHFFEHVHHEKGIWVYPSDDPLLDEINNIKTYGELFFDEKIKRYKNYDYDSLSRCLKVYMQKKDADFFNKWYKQHKFKDNVHEWNFDRQIAILEREKGELTNEDLEAVLLGKVMVTSTYKKAKDSARRAYSNLLGLIRANLDKFGSFFTLTFARKENKQKYDEFGSSFKYVNDPKDFKEVKNKFSGFINTLSKNMRRRGLDFEYVATWEMHKDGSFHFHVISSEIPRDLLCDAPEWLDVDFKTQKRRYGKMLTHWDYGKSDYEEIKDKERLSTYVSKYILKSFNNIDDSQYETFLNAKKYFSSRGLEKPTIKYIYSEDEFEEVIEKTKKYTEVYQKEYRNFYNDGKIVKMVYSKNIT